MHPLVDLDHCRIPLLLASKDVPCRCLTLMIQRNELSTSGVKGMFQLKIDFVLTAHASRL